MDIEDADKFLAWFFATLFIIAMSTIMLGIGATGKQVVFLLPIWILLVCMVRKYYYSDEHVTRRIAQRRNRRSKQE